MNEIKGYIKTLEEITAFMKGILENEDKASLLTSEETYEVKKLRELTQMRMLSRGSAWPNAVPPELLCGEDEDSKTARAAGILQELTVDIKNKNFLDYGCGEGHIPFIAASMFNAKIAIGYDVKDQNWSHFNENNRQLENFKLTSQWDDVLKTGPYDIITVNDVIDHSGDPIKALEQIKQAKAPETGKIFMRCHPWTSRHGTHLYRQSNKAYLQLVFTQDELFAMGLKETTTQPILDPLNFYRNVIKNAGFTVIKENITSHPVDLFFTHNPILVNRIKEKWKTSSDPKLASGEIFPNDIMEIQFVDYVLI